MAPSVPGTRSASRDVTPAIRTASPADAPALAALAERTFRDAFAATNAPADLDAYAAQAFSVEQTRAELADPAATFWLALGADGTFVGYAKLRRGPAEPCVSGPAPVELQRIYSGATGRGVGAALLAAALSAARAEGFGTVWLGVWDRNPRAVAFYEREGFRVVGSHSFRLGADDQTDLVMERPL